MKKHQTNMNQLPIEVTTEIISRLSTIKEKVRCKTLSKYCKDAAVAALSRQQCLSFSRADDFWNFIPYRIKCRDRASRLNIEMFGNNRFRRKFFSELCCLKVIRFPVDRKWTCVWRYYLTEGPYQHLQYLQVYLLEFPVNLPNLRHLSCIGTTIEALDSIINNSPHLTQLAINVYQLTFNRRKKKPTENLCDVLSRLPLGLESLRITCYETDVFAVLSSPAMSTIKYLYFDSIQIKEAWSLKELKFHPSPNLEIFGINGMFSENRRYSNTLFNYLTTANNMKRVELNTTWLSVEDRDTLFKSVELEGTCLPVEDRVTHFNR